MPYVHEKDGDDLITHLSPKKRVRYPETFLTYTLFPLRLGKVSSHLRHGLCHAICYLFKKLKHIFGSRGGGGVQGVRPHPLNDLRLSNTNGLPLPKKNELWFIGVEVKNETSLKNLSVNAVKMVVP